MTVVIMAMAISQPVFSTVPPRSSQSPHHETTLSGTQEPPSCPSVSSIPLLRRACRLGEYMALRVSSMSLQRQGPQDPRPQGRFWRAGNQQVQFLQPGPS